MFEGALVLGVGGKDFGVEGHRLEEKITLGLNFLGGRVSMRGGIIQLWC